VQLVQVALVAVSAPDFQPALVGGKSRISGTTSELSKVNAPQKLQMIE
jgi:hypothetical protein